MSALMLLLTVTEETEDKTNITPVLLKFGAKFLVIFTIVAVVTVLTPHLAKWVDAQREKHRKPEAPEDPRCKAVKGPYDMPEPLPKQKKEPEKDGNTAAERTGYRPKHAKKKRKKTDSSS